MKEKIKKLIKYFCQQYSGLSRTQLIKLIYLFDRIYYLEYEKKYTELSWILYYYGPYSQVIKDVYDELKKDGEIKEMPGLTRYYIFPSEDLGQEEIQLSREERKVLEKLKEEVEKHQLLSSVETMKYYVYKLPEVEKAHFSKEIDFSIATDIHGDK